MMDHKARGEVWDVMIYADSLHRFYSVVAAKKSKVDFYSTVGTAALALLSIVLIVLPSGQTSAATLTVSLTFVVSVVSLWGRFSGTIDDVILCQKRLSSLHNEARELWLQIDSVVLDDDYVHKKIRALSDGVAEATDHMASKVPKYKKLYKPIESETHDYWRRHATRTADTA